MNSKKLGFTSSANPQMGCNMPDFSTLQAYYRTECQLHFPEENREWDKDGDLGGYELKELIELKENQNQIQILILIVSDRGQESQGMRAEDRTESGYIYRAISSPGERSQQSGQVQQVTIRDKWTHRLTKGRGWADAVTLRTSWWSITFSLLYVPLCSCLFFFFFCLLNLQGDLRSLWLYDNCLVANLKQLS